MAAASEEQIKQVSIRCDNTIIIDSGKQSPSLTSVTSSQRRRHFFSHCRAKTKWRPFHNPIGPIVNTIYRAKQSLASSALSRTEMFNQIEKKPRLSVRMVHKTTHKAKGHNYQAIGTLCFLSRRISL